MPYSNQRKTCAVHHMGPVETKHVFVECQQNNKSADEPVHPRSFISALFIYLEKYNIYKLHAIFIILASLGSSADWFEPNLVEKSRRLVSRDESIKLF